MEMAGWLGLAVLVAAVYFFIPAETGYPEETLRQDKVMDELTQQHGSPQCKQDVVDLLMKVQTGHCSCRKASDILFPQFTHANVGKAAEIVIEEDDDDDRSLKERVTEVMCETQPSWGRRIERVLSVLDLDFGDADSLDWGMQRDFFRLFVGNPEAVEAMARGDYEFPPRGTVLR